MKLIKELLKAGMIIGILTILTQVGGIIYILYKPFGAVLEEKIKRIWIRLPLKATLFSGLFVISSIWIVPKFAASYGRVPLPLFASDELPLKPGGLWICLTNRHYVKPALFEAISSIARETSEKYPGTEISYLDANFPFYDGFPLLPHRSHDDGKKLDISFLYQTARTQERINQTPTWLGYGFSEGPKEGEYDQISVCEKKGYWQYSLMSKLVSSRKRTQFIFDESANATLLRIIAKQAQVKKIFIEPHLKERLGLGKYDKIRFHGCKAVRHDDHIHLQI